MSLSLEMLSLSEMNSKIMHESTEKATLPSTLELIQVAKLLQKGSEELDYDQALLEWNMLHRLLLVGLALEQQLRL